MTVKGTDYSKSAIDLTNSNEVLNLLNEYGNALEAEDIAQQAVLETAESKAFYDALHTSKKAKEAVKVAIDRCGSFQDVGKGLYALKQRKTSVSYDPVRVREFIPDAVAMAIIETVPNRKIDGLLKGKMITEEQASSCRIVAELAPAYIIDILKEGTDADKGINKTLAEGGQASC